MGQKGHRFSNDLNDLNFKGFFAPCKGGARKTWVIWVKWPREKSRWLVTLAAVAYILCDIFLINKNR
jgi:hypothetical protein